MLRNQKMTNNEWKKELFSRMTRFAVRIVLLASSLPKTLAGFAVASQLVRSGTSIGANVQEAQDASSRKDFIQKLSISLREARETHYWLDIIVMSKLLSSGNIDELQQECEEFVAILVTSLKSAKNISTFQSHFSSSKGFTLIELVATMGILLIVSIIVGNVYFTALRGASKTDTLSTVRQNGEVALSIMTKAIRHAKRFDGVSTDGVAFKAACAVEVVGVGTPTPSPIPYKQVRITGIDGGITTFSCNENVDDDPPDTIASTSANPTVKSSLFDPSSAELSACYFTCEKTSGSDYPILGIFFTLREYQPPGIVLVQEKTTRPIDFHSAVVLRNLTR